MNWIIPAIIANMRSRADKTWTITINTNELTPEKVSQISANLNSFGFLAFKEDEFKTDELEAIDRLKADYEDSTISPAKRLKSVLYLNWKEDNNGYDDSEKYYIFEMSKITDHFKSKLP